MGHHDILVDCKIHNIYLNCVALIFAFSSLQFHCESFGVVLGPSDFIQQMYGNIKEFMSCIGQTVIG